MTSTNLQTTSALGLALTCQKVTLHYEVEVNGLDHVVLQPTAARNATTENCHVVTPTSPPVTHTVHTTNAGTGELTINTWGTGEAAATLATTITGVATCSYAGILHFQATGGSALNVGPSGLTGFCGPATFHGDFILETSNGSGPVTLDYVNTG